MNYKKGIWIDTKKAVVVTLENGERKTRVVVSGVETRPRIEEEDKQYTRLGNQHFPDESSRENKVGEEKRSFVKSLITDVKSCSEIVLFGPSDMKHFLQKEIENHHGLSGKIAAVEDADSMTDNQVAAWVDDFFNSRIGK